MYKNNLFIGASYQKDFYEGIEGAVTGAFKSFLKDQDPKYALNLNVKPFLLQFKYGDRGDYDKLEVALMPDGSKLIIRAVHAFPLIEADDYYIVMVDLE